MADDRRASGISSPCSEYCRNDCHCRGQAWENKRHPRPCSAGVQDDSAKQPHGGKDQAAYDCVHHAWGAPKMPSPRTGSRYAGRIHTSLIFH